MSMLYRKDLRLLFPIFLTAVGFWVVLLAFGGIAYLMSDRPRPTSDLMTLLSAISAACLSASAVVAPALGGGVGGLRRVGLQALFGLLAAGLFILVAVQALLEVAQGAAEVGADVAQLAGAENHHDHDKQDDEMPDAHDVLENQTAGRRGRHRAARSASA